MFAFSSSEPGSAFQCQIGDPWHACSSPVTYGSLADGLHVFSVRAIDALGNTDATEATRIFIVRDTPGTTAPPVATPSPKGACKQRADLVAECIAAGFGNSS